MLREYSIYVQDCDVVIVDNKTGLEEANDYKNKNSERKLLSRTKPCPTFIFVNCSWTCASHLKRKLHFHNVSLLKFHIQ